MHFSKSSVLSLLALVSVVASQVVITVTDTVTVLTVTVAPKSTSTSIVYVTVGGNPPNSQPTIARTVTLTTSPAPTPTGWTCPIPEWGQCGGLGYQRSCAGACGSNSVCKYKDDWYSYCSDLPGVVV